MVFAHAVLLGALEGFTEFLPISSTGHLILVSRLLGLPSTPFQTTFSIGIQLGAILAVLAFSWRTLLADRALILRVFAAFAPTAFIGFLAYRLVTEVFFDSVTLTLVALFVGGLVLIALERGNWQRETMRPLGAFPIPFAIAIGLFQSASIVPGVSRAAATIIGGLLLGLSRRDAVRFSFFLAIPTMAGATGLDLLKTPIVFTRDELFLLLIGFLTAFVVAFLTVRWFVRYVETHTFVPFGVYRIVLAALLWAIL